MKVVGLTGGMGSGKSTIAAMLLKAHIPVIDADELARLVTSRGSEGLKLIIERFGDSVLERDQSLNRLALGKIVFNDPAALGDLENIVHPAIEKLRTEFLSKLRSQGHDIAVYMAPLLFEKGLEYACDKTLLVMAPKEQALARIKLRDSLSEEQIKKRLAFQMSDQEKMAKADEIIINDSSKEDLFLKLQSTWKRLCDRELLLNESI